MRFENTDDVKADLVTNGVPMVKKPNPVYMRQIPEDFNVETNEGWLYAHAGDYLAHDPISGHIWPVAADYVAVHYDPK